MTSVVEADFQGYLYKRGEGGLQLYKRRYFVLRDNDLYYSVDNSLSALLNPLGKIDLTRVSKVSCLVDVGTLFGPNVHYVYLFTPHRTYDLYAESKLEGFFHLIIISNRKLFTKLFQTQRKTGRSTLKRSLRNMQLSVVIKKR